MFLAQLGAMVVPPRALFTPQPYASWNAERTQLEHGSCSVPWNTDEHSPDGLCSRSRTENEHKWYKFVFWNTECNTSANIERVQGRAGGWFDIFGRTFLGGHVVTRVLAVLNACTCVGVCDATRAERAVLC